jgi:hypothetical protein
VEEKIMKLIFLNTKRGDTFGKHKIFEEPVSFKEICHQLDPESIGEAELDGWVLDTVEGDKTLVKACFEGCAGTMVLDMQNELDFTAEIFEEWNDEKLLSLLARGAEMLSTPFDDFVYRKWTVALKKEDFITLMNVLKESDPKITESVKGRKVTRENVASFVKDHPKRILEIEDYYIVLSNEV